MSRMWQEVLYFPCVFQVYLTLVFGWTIVHSSSLYWAGLSKISVFAIARVSFVDSNR